MFARLLDLVFPAYCELCHTRLSHGRNLCEPCVQNLPHLEAPYCQICCEPFDGNIKSPEACPNCSQLKLAFDFTYAPLHARDDARELIHHLKYKRRFFLARDLAAILADSMQVDPRLAAMTPPLPVIPVPLHWNRERKRTGNQAYELAHHFCKETNHLLTPALKRIRATSTQTRLSRHKRLQNLKGAFSISRKYQSTLTDQTVILIDDVFTTGATAHECSRILKKEAGVKKVIVLCVLRG